MRPSEGPRPEPVEGFVQVNSLNLHYLEWPSPGPALSPVEGPALSPVEGPPALLLHATGFLARLWQPYAERLAGRYHVYAYDARGHGDSDKPPDDYGWDRFAEDLAAFLDAFSLRQVAAIGHSSGGAAALYCAAHRPELFSRIVAIEPIIFPPDVRQDADYLAAGARKRRAVWPNREEMMRNYRSRRTFSHWREDVLRLYIEYGTFLREDSLVELKCPGEIEARIYEGRPAADTWSALLQVRCPTLIMRGEKTDPYLVWASEAVARRIPDARLVTIEGSSHFSPMEKPDAMLAAIERFLEEGG